MFWFKKEKPSEIKVEELIENPLRNRLRILFDNLCNIVNYKIPDDRLKVLWTDCQLKVLWGDCHSISNTSNLYKVKIRFESNLGPVEVTMREEGLNQISLDYEDMNKFYFGIYCDSEISTIPMFSTYNNINAEDVDLALYELEHYIEEKHLDKVSLESYNAQELNKLVEQSAERIKDK